MLIKNLLATLLFTSYCHIAVAMDTAPTSNHALPAPDKVIPKTVKQKLTKKFVDICSQQNIQLSDFTSESKILNLSGKLQNLDDIPDDFWSSLSQLIWLESLDLSHNNLETIPDQISQLKHLTDLSLHHNQLITLPSSIGSLKYLFILNAAYNPLQILPPALGQITTLRRLNLSYSYLTTVPSRLGELSQVQIIDLTNSPLSPKGDALQTHWGQEELQNRFGDRFFLNNTPIIGMNPMTTAEEVYKILDSQPIRINREWLKTAILPEIEEKGLEGKDLIALFKKIMDKSNTLHAGNPGYLAYDDLMTDFANDYDTQELSNEESIKTFYIPRIMGFLKTLYGIPLEEGEIPGWQMYEDQTPELQLSLSYLLQEIDKKDIENRAAMIKQLSYALLHCPTAQAENLNTLTYTLSQGKYIQDLPRKILHHTALYKNHLFQQVILFKTSENGQNSHWVSHYRDKLKDTLGLSSALKTYTNTKMGTYGLDPFSGNKYNVLSVFYEALTPANLVSHLMSLVQTSEDLRIKGYLAELEKLSLSNEAPKSLSLKDRLEEMMSLLQRDEIPSKFTKEVSEFNEQEKKDWILEKITTLETHLSLLNKQSKKEKTVTLSTALLAYLKDQKLITDESPTADMINDASKKIKQAIKTNKNLRPISTGDVLAYLKENKIVNMEDANCWQGYFTLPLTDPLATLTSTVIEKILFHMQALVSD